MRRMGMIAALLAMLGLGILLGSAMTPTATAQTTTTTVTPLPPVTAGTAVTYPYYANTPYGYPPVRWQVVLVPGIERAGQPVVILLDSLSGESFYLDTNNGRFYWARIIR